MKSKLILFTLSLFFLSCGGSGTETSSSSSKPSSPPPKQEAPKPKADNGKGVGEIKKVVLNDALNEDWIAQGKSIYELKCSACHKLTAKRVVGPGWKGLTSTRKPEWIMNMITNVEAMLDEDPAAQKLLEECLTRMPNQNVTVEEARSILEFMISNDKEG